MKKLLVVLLFMFTLTMSGCIQDTPLPLIECGEGTVLEDGICVIDEPIVPVAVYGEAQFLGVEAVDIMPDVAKAEHELNEQHQLMDHLYF